MGGVQRSSRPPPDDQALGTFDIHLHKVHVLIGVDDIIEAQKGHDRSGIAHGRAGRLVEEATVRADVRGEVAPTSLTCERYGQQGHIRQIVLFDRCPKKETVVGVRLNSQHGTFLPDERGESNGVIADVRPDVDAAKSWPAKVPEHRRDMRLEVVVEHERRDRSVVGVQSEPQAVLLTPENLVAHEVYGYGRGIRLTVERAEYVVDVAQGAHTVSTLQERSRRRKQLRAMAVGGVEDRQ